MAKEYEQQFTIVDTRNNLRMLWNHPSITAGMKFMHRHMLILSRYFTIILTWDWRQVIIILFFKVQGLVLIYNFISRLKNVAEDCFSTVMNYNKIFWSSVHAVQTYLLSKGVPNYFTFF